MITEQQIDILVERLIRRIEEANTYFLKKIGSSVAKIKELTPSQAQQLVQILKYGGSYEEIIKEIARYTDLNIKDIDEIFSAYAKKDYAFYKKFYQYRNIPYIPYEQNIALRTQTQALANIVKNEAFNYFRTNVLGYTIKDLNGKGRFLGLRETYNTLLDEALLNVSQGKQTFDSAMARIMEQIGGSGLKTLEYQSGRGIRLDSAISMHLRGRLIELHNENQKIIGEEIGTDGVEITVHANPAPDHEQIQGRQFSYEEFDKLQAGEVAIDYKGVARTLDHDGKNGHRPIGEMNCYHRIFTIILGVREPSYTDEQLNEMIKANEKGFEFEGNHYSLYEGTQLQRSIEREIRKQKDIQIFAKAGNNEDLIFKSQEKITMLTNKYKELSDASKLPMQVERFKVANYKRIAKSKLK